jgi:hypothetical protein
MEECGLLQRRADEQDRPRDARGTSVYLLSTLTNVLSGATDDPAFAGFRWQRPAQLG